MSRVPAGRSVHVRVPASSANLGPGFDSIGLALGLWDDYVVTTSDTAGLLIEVTGEGASDVPTDEGHWAMLYGANSSIKRSFLERVGVYDEERLPYLYEDIDWGYRAREHGLRVIYDRHAVVDHWRPMTLEVWKARAPMLAATEWQFCQMHPEIEPWYYNMFSDADRVPAAGRKARQLARFVSPRVPLIGPWVWSRADVQWRKEIAPHFLQAWEKAARGELSSQPDVGALLAERSASSGGS